MHGVKLAVVQLNELNFDVIRAYVARGHLPAFRSLLGSFRAMETYAEEEYRLLEPWIQWVSAHTGKTFGEHGIFRLGDMANVDIPQVFEMLESAGLRVGALSPMNARNRLKCPAYFVPDPWTQTASDNSAFSRRLTAMLRQTVNENAEARISPKSLLTLMELVVRTIDRRRTTSLLGNIAIARNRPWMRALILDQLFHMVHLHLIEKRSPDVSFIFLNAGAHIQHHYFLNAQVPGIERRNPGWYVPATADPVLDMLCVYDDVLADYLAMARTGVRVIVATGLSQVPYDRVKFYYRLKSHGAFLRRIGISFDGVLPRMTRDFEVTFADSASKGAARSILGSARMQRDGKPIFGEIEDRETGLFVTLTYPDEILDTDGVDFSTGQIPGFLDHVSFVAIKNGMHSTRGFAFLSGNIPAKLPESPVHVSRLFDITLDAAR